MVTEIGMHCNSFSTCTHSGREPEFISLEEFLPRVTLVAEGVPKDIALEYINQAAIDFCTRALILKRRLVFDIQSDVQDYYLQAGEYEKIYYIHSMRYGCNVTLSNFNCDIPLHGFSDQYFSFEPPDKIWIKDKPIKDQKNAVEVIYFAVPNPEACMVDRLLFDRYQDAIVSGALAHLLLMRKYQFADPQLAAIYDNRFLNAINAAKIHIARQFQSKQTSIIPDLTF